MASLDHNTNSASASSNTAANSGWTGKNRGFRLIGEVQDYFRGMTKASGNKPAQPYVRVKIEGETTTGKKVAGTIMAFGEKAIANLDIAPNTKRAGVFVAYDRSKNARGNVMIPMGPYKAA